MTHPGRLRTILSLLAALTCGRALAMPIVKTELDRDRVPADETVMLTVTYPSDCEVETLQSDKFEVLSFDSQAIHPSEAKKLKQMKSKFSRATQVEALGGATKGLQRRNAYEIHPLAAGVVKVPSLLVTCSEDKTRTAAKTFTALPAGTAVPPGAAAAKKKEEADPDAMLYQPVTLDSPSIPAVKPAPSQAPPASSPILSHEAVPAPSQPPLPVPPAAPGQMPAPATATEEKAAQQADKVASYVQGFAKGLSKAVDGKDNKLASAGKDFASAGKTMASMLEMVLLAALALAGAAATLWGVFIGFKAYRKTRHYEGMRLWVLSKVAQPQKEEKLLGGKYKVITELGEGGMGTVLLAEDVKLGRKVALKRLHAEARFDIRQREKLLEEARIISQLNHPYIVGIHEILEWESDIYLVFDYVEGRPLSHILHDRKRLPIWECVDIFTSVCQAIDYAHKKNVLHLDIKPSNIMVDSNGFAKVMDFGLARRDAKDDSFSGVGGSGTFWYMSPEQHSGVTTPAADIYGIGVTIYEALTGDIPFKGPDYLRQKDHLFYVAPSKLVPDLPPGVDQFISDAFKPQMTERFPGGVLALLDRLKALAEASPQTPTPLGPS